MGSEMCIRDRILVEEPIKVGDRVEVGEVSGDIVNISLRSTTIVTNDNISIIVPNSEFVSSQVINWSHNNRIVRFRLPIGVSYNEDPEIVRKLLLEVADENPNVQKEPKPKVFFDNFGDSSLDFMHFLTLLEIIQVTLGNELLSISPYI